MPRPDNISLAVVGGNQGVAPFLGTHIDFPVELLLVFLGFAQIIRRSRVYLDQIPLAVVAYGIFGLPDDFHVLCHVFSGSIDLFRFIFSIRIQVICETVATSRFHPVIGQERQQLYRLDHKAVGRGDVQFIRVSINVQLHIINT